MGEDDPVLDLVLEAMMDRDNLPAEWRTDPAYHEHLRGTFAYALLSLAHQAGVPLGDYGYAMNQVKLRLKAHLN